ncbi:dTMP kinase [Oerskovia turbata]|uniref:Thymidylate kinase n=1 Tax=Oerskovia turbata TaxID=1713 RepID=A0A4Q1L0K8_9CELL|nr:dTMP kinase [Oerskovia turbata]RXR35194.1 dTMP kinase [Oerskovia turbata]TGJ96439.1 dTMP kinase [Actinotalea fermentans ATCC 43279 = JCM 9966 = DSM 3133]
MPPRLPAAPGGPSRAVRPSLVGWPDYRGRVSTPGYFISFEGGDAVGKSTQSRLLGQWLGELTGREVVLTREPGGTELGVELRQAVLHGRDMDARTEALIYAADRAHHVAHLVRPALERGAVVVTDRYLDSSVAYQSGGRELGVDEVELISLWAVQGLMPHVTVLLDLDPAVAAERLQGKPDRLESAGIDFHRRTREAFLRRAAADPERWVVIDATASIDDIQAQIRVDLAARLELTPVVEEAEDTIEALPDDGFDDSDSAIGYAPDLADLPVTRPVTHPAPGPAAGTAAP